MVLKMGLEPITYRLQDGYTAIVLLQHGGDSGN